MNWVKQSGLAFAAYHLSSVITAVQMNVASVVAPEKYNLVMDKMAIVTVPAWQFAVESAQVVWEFLQSP